MHAVGSLPTSLWEDHTRRNFLSGLQAPPTPQVSAKPTPPPTLLPAPCSCFCVQWQTAVVDREYAHKTGHGHWEREKPQS